jgi:hypothetical protein
MNWPLHRKIYATACSWFYAFAVYVVFSARDD